MFGRDGWVRFLLSTVSRGYLVFLLTLTVTALLPALFGWHGSVIQSGSMRPHVNPGDVVLSSALPDEAEVPVGGVVEFSSPRGSGEARTVMHRIVADNGDDTYTTAGDANPDPDSGHLTRAQITGQARLLVPFVGLPGLWLGRGDLMALGLWSALMLLALAAAADGMRSHRAAAPRPGAPGGTAGTGAGAVPGVALTVAAGVILAGLAGTPLTAARAAFTATTTTAATWSVAEAAPLFLGRAAPYALLAATGITNAGPPGQTTIDGSVGTSPGRTITGFSPGHTGSIDAGTETSRGAMTDAAALHAAASKRPGTALHSVLTGTVTPGVYDTTGTGFSLTGRLVLDGHGDPDALFILRAPVLTTAPGSTVTLVNGAAARNIYWITSAGISIGAKSTVVGNHLAAGGIQLGEGVSLTGRLVSLTGAITLNTINITLPR